MTSRIKRCIHCNDIYTYHPSSVIDPLNNQDYCPVCYGSILNALKIIPIKFVRKFIKTTDYTKQQILNVYLNRSNFERQGAFSRVLPGLVNTEKNIIQRSICEIMPDPISKSMFYYSATYWEDNPNEAEIKKEVWWDVEKDCIANNQNDFRG